MPSKIYIKQHKLMPITKAPTHWILINCRLNRTVSSIIKKACKPMYLYLPKRATVKFILSEYKRINESRELITKTIPTKTIARLINPDVCKPFKWNTYSTLNHSPIERDGQISMHKNNLSVLILPTKRAVNWPIIMLQANHQNK